MKTKITTIIPLAVVLLAALLSAACPAAVFDHDLHAKKSDGFSQAIFKLWLPDDPGPVRGIVVSSVKDRFFLDDPEWKKFAVTHHMAMLRNNVTGAIPQNHMGYENGPIWEPALAQALTALAVASKHPELTAVPLLTHGKCVATEGGFFPWRKTTSVAFGQRVIAFAVIDDSSWTQLPKSAEKKAIIGALHNIPGLLVVDGKVQPQDAATAKGIYAINRKQGAPWCLVLPEKRSDQLEQKLVRAFFEGVIALRMPPQGANKSVIAKLDPIDQAKGWLGDPKTKEVLSPIAYTRPKGEAVWLPDEATGKLWNEYSSAK